MIKLTNEINTALLQIQAEDHVVHSGLKAKLLESVSPVFDKGDNDAYFPLRPSGCLKPLRDLYYDLKNFYEPNTIPKKPFEPRTKLIFQFGHLTESLLVKLCKHNFDVQFEQQRVKYGELMDKDGSFIPLTGAIDWAMKLDSTSDELYLCDAKSIGDYPYKSAPKEANIAQMQLYMHSDWGRQNNVNKAILIYFNKNTSDIKCIQIDYDSGLATKLFGRLALAFEFYKKDEPPPREYLAGIDWQADYSQYKDYDNKEFTYLPDTRKVIIVSDYYKPSKYTKENIRSHAEKYGSYIARYLDKAICLLYDNGKLELIEI